MKKRKLLYISITLIIILIVIICIVVRNSKIKTTNKEQDTIENSDTYSERNNITGKKDEYGNIEQVNDKTYSSWEELSDSIDNGNKDKLNNSEDSENVILTIEEDTITNTSVTVMITDNHSPHYSWGREYTIQKNINGEWQDLEPIREMTVEAIAYFVNENNQIEQKIDWEKDYGELQSGTYRIVKRLRKHDDSYVSFYSNEFEIK